MGPALDEVFLARWVERLRGEEPGAVAVLLKGSYARGDAGPHSDVDFDVLTDGEPAMPYPAYLEEAPDGRLLHVSVAVKPLDEWLARDAIPVSWSYSLAAEEATRLLWAASDSLQRRLDRTARPRPPGPTELEDFVADFGKVKNARAAGDELALRLAAQGLATLCPSVLKLVNPDPETRPASHREALLAALALPVAPPGYREDMLVCLGITGRATTSEDVYQSAHRRGRAAAPPCGATRARAPAGPAPLPRRW